MGNRHSFPFAGIVLALISFAGLLAFGIALELAAAVLIIWVGSLFLTSSQPPEIADTGPPQPFTRDNMEQLVENSATPLLVTENDRIAIANRTARKLMGAHIIGQDTRVAFRQPEAIAFLGKKRNGMTMIRGLIRRRDKWQMNRQSLGKGLAVIELVDQTSESDISRAHTDFVANASHELRTPLAAIIGYAETLGDEDAGLDETTSRKFLGTILREAKRLQSLVSDLMSLSRVEAEKHDEPQNPIALAKLVERASHDAAGEERDERVELALGEVPQVLGDEQQLEQLVRNLVDNALKYGDPDKAIRVELALGQNDHVRLTVSDKGEGIAPEHIPHLTRRFYRTDPGRSRASGGTGLGLAIVKHIVERHRGRLDIQSVQGEGTQVIVRIPAIASAETKAE